MAAFRLQMLVDYAQERSKSAAQELRRVRLKWAHEEQKKHQLEGYLEDYRGKFTGTAMKGITVSAMMDFRRFISKLELAIRTQTEEIVRCRQQWELAQKFWQEREREVKAYLALRKRHEQAEQAKENRQEQKLLDEFAQNGYRRHKSEQAAELAAEKLSAQK
jgi:flagellar FliJ protein